MSETLAKPRQLWKEPTVWRLLLVALLAEIGYAVLNISTMPVYLRDDRHFGEFSVVLVLSGFLLSEAVMKGPMGHFADRYGSRKLMLTAPVITVCTALLTLILPRFDPEIGEPIELLMFVGLRLLDGVGAAMLWPAAFALMGHTVEDGKRQQAMSLLNMCYLMGVALALPLGGLVEDSTSNLLAKSLGSKSGGILLAAALFVLVFLTTYRMVRSDTHEVDTEHKPQPFRDLLHTFRQIPSYLILAVIVFMGIGFPMGVIKLFAQDEFRLSATQFGALVMPGALAMAFLSVPVSKLGERLGKAKAVHLGLLLCSLGLTVIALGAFFDLFRTTFAFAVCGIPVGLGFLLTVPAWLASVSDLDPKKRAANLGAVMTAQGMGAIIGVPVGGLLYEKITPPHLGHYAPFLGTAACLWFAFALSMRILKH